MTENAFIKLSCDGRFQSAFTACSWIFKVITPVGSNQGNFLKTQLHAVNARWKRVSQRSLRIVSFEETECNSNNPWKGVFVKYDWVICGYPKGITKGSIHVPKSSFASLTQKKEQLKMNPRIVSCWLISQVWLARFMSIARMMNTPRWDKFN